MLHVASSCHGFPRAAAALPESSAKHPESVAGGGQMRDSSSALPVDTREGNLLRSPGPILESGEPAHIVDDPDAPRGSCERSPVRRGLTVALPLLAIAVQYAVFGGGPDFFPVQD